MGNRRKSKAGCLLTLLLGLMLAAAAVIGITYDAQPDTPTEAMIRAYAAEHGIRFSQYPQSLIDLLERNPETKDFVLEYPLKKDQAADTDIREDCESGDVPLLMQWDQRWGYLQYGSDVAGLTGCGPLCLSMVGWYLTEDDAFTPDKMLAFAAENGYYSPGNGSSWTLISEGGVKLGLDVTEIPLVKSRIFKNLEVGNPIICAMGPGDFTTGGHYIVLVGCEDGLIRVNDPNSRANSAKLWSYEEMEDQFRNLWVIRK